MRRQRAKRLLTLFRRYTLAYCAANGDDRGCREVAPRFERHSRTLQNVTVWTHTGLRGPHGSAFHP